MTSYDFSYYLWEFAEDFTDEVWDLKDKVKKIEEKIIDVWKILIEQNNIFINWMKDYLNYLTLTCMWFYGSFLRKNSWYFLMLYLHWNWRTQYFWKTSILWREFINSYVYKDFKIRALRWLKEYSISKKKYDSEYKVNITGKHLTTWIPWNFMKEERKIESRIQNDFENSVWWVKYKSYIRVKIISDNKIKVTVHIWDRYDFHLKSEDWELINNPFNTAWYNLSETEIFDLFHWWRFKTGREFDWYLDFEEIIYY